MQNDEGYGKFRIFGCALDTAPRQNANCVCFCARLFVSLKNKTERIMRKIGIIAALLFAAGNVSAQVSISAAASNGAGGQTVVQTDTIAEQRLWPDFHAVEIEGPMKVCFETADAEHPVGISYYANDFKTGKYVSKVENGVLKLKMQRQKSADSLQVTVRYNSLNSVKVSGGDIRFVGLLKTNLLDVKVSGGARFEATLDVADLQLEVTGRSNVILNGKSRYMDASVSTAVVDASQLQVMAVTVDASNKAEVTVQATDRIVMKSTTSAVIRYAGNPAIERSRTSSMLSGSFERLDSNKK